ncbi:SDR family oxidoreductase [Nonomuraea sp. NPDC050536]|uniref:SDR family oxidoreductase n=1 Tax=Nonomuraea sp. NPDC050536 TaxID=3364366 RepID=UPI0037CA8F83
MTVTYDYAGKVVLVTGGTRGIGAGIATAFRDAGADVIVCGRRPADVPGFVQADVRDPDDVDRLVGGLERLDVVVNNAGGSPYAPVAGTSPRLHARVIELNLIAPLLVAQRAHPLLAAARGSIIMIGSSSGARPSPGTSAYGAAKAGLHHLAACLAAEWAPDVRVNTVVVGLAEAPGHYGGATVESTIPFGRLASPADVASVCLWLASPGYVTGAQVAVHGGGEVPAWRYLTGQESLAP